jgi:hypothetical protein
MTVDPTTYTATFDYDGNGKDDTVTFSVIIAEGAVFVQGTAVLDNGTHENLGGGFPVGSATLSFDGKNGGAAGTFTVSATANGQLGAVSFKGTEDRLGLVDHNGKPVSEDEQSMPDFHKWAHEFHEDVYTVNVNRSFAVTPAQ